MTDADRMTVWLREALDTAQREAEAAARAFPAWEFDERVKEVRDVPNAGTVAFIAVPQYGPHIARQSPSAVLRRIAADRKQLAEHTPVPNHGRLSDHGGCERFSCDRIHLEPPVCRSCRTSVADPVEAPCPSLENLAEAWGWVEEEQR